MELSADIKNFINVDQAWHYKVIPSQSNGNSITLLMDESADLFSTQTELEIVLGKKVLVQKTPSAQIEQLLFRYYPKSNQGYADVANSAYRLNIQSGNFIEQLVKEAKELNSSDIHIETYGDKSRVRFRINGQLVDRHKLSKAEYPVLINKIKVAAKCLIEEKRLPQDGRIRVQLNTSKIDIRVSILPTLYGEKIVMRLLGSDASHIEITRLGFKDDEYLRYSTAIQKPNGIILISGPTGSGKTTTLYATLKQLNKPTSNILTIEDPIEYTLDGVNQVQLKEEIGLNYSEALRTFLRQDPDTIMLGEIRDAETAQMAIRASLTGHLVLSTIHTNSAWGTVSRLIDMGVPGFLLASTLNLSVAQRLVRTLCPNCKTATDLHLNDLPEKYRHLKINVQYKAKGCNHCYFTGFSGRKAIYEVINISRELSELIKQNATEIDAYCKTHKINRLADNALALFQVGDTTLEEIYPYLINEN